MEAWKRKKKRAEAQAEANAIALAAAAQASAPKEPISSDDEEIPPALTFKGDVTNNSN